MTTENVNQAVKPENIEKDGYKLEYSEFGKDSILSGFGFYTIQFKTKDAACAHLGDEAVLTLINRAAAAGLGVKARNQLTKEDGEDNEKYQERVTATLVADGPILVTPSDAESWKPGEREVNSISGVTKKMQLALKEAKDAKSKGDAERFAKCVAEAKEFKAQLDKLQDEELALLAA